MVDGPTSHVWDIQTKVTNSALKNIGFHHLRGTHELLCSVLVPLRLSWDIVIRRTFMLAAKPSIKRADNQSATLFISIQD